MPFQRYTDYLDDWRKPSGSVRPKTREQCICLKAMFLYLLRVCTLSLFRLGFRVPVRSASNPNSRVTCFTH